ncbi:hypothetical protein RvY_03885 [Ramazzottius varieornatus]|uniref:Uncharacterized protein n=1 Tax=Ramazzottius varieornatus TaxID=947166 RepID=A0A1D1UT82_RAMVA|nr:hypothetical protein RvY_03885 [Ramazzottius varieornatus]
MSVALTKARQFTREARPNRVEMIRELSAVVSLLQADHEGSAADQHRVPTCGALSEQGLCASRKTGQNRLLSHI